MDDKDQSLSAEVIFWGATGQAKVLRECLDCSGVRLIALFDNNERLASPFEDVPLYHGKQGFESWIRTRSEGSGLGFLVAIGGDKGRDRIEIQEYLESHKLVGLIARHPTAFIAANAIIGAGSQILAQSAVCVETRIGRGCIVNTGAVVDHECRIGDGVHVGPGARLAGCVNIESYATIYTGAVIAPRIQIGQGAIVGAGAVVIHDVEPYTMVAGNPARVIKEAR